MIGPGVTVEPFTFPYDRMLPRTLIAIPFGLTKKALAHQMYDTDVTL
jgi:hypothetical protein